MSLVSRTFNADTDPFLWYSISIPPEGFTALLVAACDAILRIPKRAACIRTLILPCDVSLMIESKRRHEELSDRQFGHGWSELTIWDLSAPIVTRDQSLALLSQAMTTMRQLEYLRFGEMLFSTDGQLKLYDPVPKPAPGYTCVLNGLATNSLFPPFKLRKLDVFWGHLSLFPFLHTQPHLEGVFAQNLDALAWRTDASGVSPGLAMQTLKSFVGPEWLLECIHPAPNLRIIIIIGFTGNPTAFRAAQRLLRARYPSAMGIKMTRQQSKMNSRTGYQAADGKWVYMSLEDGESDMQNENIEE